MKVCFTYVGPLKFRGRLFKQIKTLQREGFECLLIHGQTEDNPPDYSIYDFPVFPIRVRQGKLRILTLASQLNFAQKAARVIKKIGVGTVVCVALQSALSGAIAKNQNPKIKFIFDNNELSLEMINSGVKRKVWSVIHKYIIRHTDVIIHAENQRLNYFHRTYKTSAKPFLLENLPFYRKSSPVRDRSKKISCVYVGLFMPGRFCTEMLTAFSKENSLNATFDMVGFYGRSEYKQTIDKTIAGMEDTSKIRILPPVHHNDMYDFLASYDIGLAFYSNTNLNNYYCAPNKIYDYIQMGIPVVTNDYPGLIDVVQNNGIGVCIPKVDTEHIRSAVQKIDENNMYANIDDTVRKRFSWENQENGYLQLFHEI